MSLAAVAKNLTFYVLAFQDIIRLAANHVYNPMLSDLLKSHYQTCKDYEQGYLDDLDTLSETPTVSFLFSSSQQLVRDVAYNLIAGILRTETDMQRTALVLSLEAAGEIFFQGFIAAFEQQNQHHSLKYFNRQHPALILSQSLTEQVWQNKLAAIPVSLTELELCEKTIDQVFAQMNTLANHLLNDIHAENELTTLSEVEVNCQ